MTELHYFTPGPTQLHPAVKAALASPAAIHYSSISHRSQEFRTLNKSVRTNLLAAMGAPAGTKLFWLSSGTEGWERVILGGVEKSSFHFVNGSFSERFAWISERLKKEVIRSTTKAGVPFSFEEINIPEQCELIALTSNETSTGFWTEEKDIAAIAKRYPEKYIAVDCVSSAPVCSLDWSHVDYALLSVQKVFGCPAGLGALLVSPRALERCAALEQSGTTTGSYHSLQVLSEFEAKDETPMTPNVLGIYLLGEVLKSLDAAGGAKKVSEQLRTRAQKLYSLVDAHPKLSAFITDKGRSPTVATIQADANLKKVLKEHGYVVGDGYGEFKETQIRIANFFSHSDQEFEDLLAVIFNY